MLQEISVIYRVYDSFLYSIIWIVPEAFRFLSAGNFTHMLFEDIALDVIHCLFYHLWNTALECNLCEIIRIFHLSVRECHYINLGIREEFVNLLGFSQNIMAATLRSKRFSLGPVYNSIWSSIVESGVFITSSANLLPTLTR